jgi:hypothetical protein
MQAPTEDEWDGELDFSSELICNIFFLFFLVLVCECWFQNILER